MSDVSVERHVTGNLFLDHLPAGSLEMLLPALTTVRLKTSELVYAAHAPMNSIFFPLGSVISVVIQMSDGDTAEVGLIGRDGMTGVAIALGQSSTNQRSVVQIPNSALTMKTQDFRAALDSVPELRESTLRYAQAVLMMAAHVLACNTLHPVDERCARWLLMAHDRVGADLLLLTQEFLGQMLGVRRASVAVAAATLQDAGFISYSRGHITVRNRLGLESASCECYETMEREWEALMGYAIQKRFPDKHPIHTDGQPH